MFIPAHNKNAGKQAYMKRKECFDFVKINEAGKAGENI